MEKNLFSSNDNITVYFKSDSNSTFTEMLKIKNLISNLDSNLEEEIYNFSQKIEIETQFNSTEFKLWRIIRTCLSKYLIIESHEKTVKNRLLSFQNFCIDIDKNQHSDETLNENDYIELRIIDFSIS